jgi:hypothetical protein
MKRILFLSLAAALLIAGCHHEKTFPVETSPIAGAWQLVSGNYITPDTLANFPVTANGHHMKIIGEKYFSTIWQDTTICKSDVWYSGFNGGTYTFKNEVYTETELYFYPISGIGNIWSAKVEIKGDTMVLTYIPADPDSKASSVEVWKRLE